MELFNGSYYIRATTGKRKGIIWVTKCSTETKTISTTENEVCGLLWPHSVTQRPWADSYRWCLVFLKLPLYRQLLVTTELPPKDGKGNGQERGTRGKPFQRAQAAEGWPCMAVNRLRYYVPVSHL